MSRVAGRVVGQVRRRIIRATIVVASAFAAPALGAQGWIVPRPCGLGIQPIEGRTPPIARVTVPPNIVRTRSDVRVELADHVLRYEVEERFVNRGATLGEADYLFPLPTNAAFQNLALSIDGELVAGETMNAGQARNIYESIVRARRDPALVEWMGHGLLHARIFPLEPGREKTVVVRFQSVAPREGDALRIDYFRGGAPGTTTFATAATRRSRSAIARRRSSARHSRRRTSSTSPTATVVEWSPCAATRAM